MIKSTLFLWDWTKKIKTRPTRFLALLLIMAMPLTVKATCTTSWPGGGPVVFTINGFNPTSVDASVPDGQILFSQVVPFTTVGNQSFTCPEGIGIIFVRGVTTLIPPDIYTTSIPGVGIKFKFTDYGKFWPITTNYGANINAPLRDNAAIQIDLIKIGAITSSGTLTGEVAGWFAQNDTSQVASITFGTPVTIVPKLPTCLVTTPDISVNLGSISANSFTGIGSASPQKAFSIDLNCAGGDTGVITSVYITLTDQGNPTNITGVMPLSSDSNAQGIGIQILKNSIPQQFGPPSDVIGNQNQWLAGVTGNGVFSIPLSARYVQTSSILTPGLAKGRAIFTIGYQ